MKILLTLRGREVTPVIDLTIDLRLREPLALGVIIPREELAVLNRRRT